MIRPFLRNLLCLALCVCGTALLSSCVPMVRQSDNGDWSFARQVFPILYGRKARGHDELKVVVDMTQRVGREATLRGMMDRPEFVDHWTELLINHMRASKEVGGMSGDQQSQRACFPQSVAPAGNAAELARWIRDNPPSAGTAHCGTAACGSFTMTDVVRSSLLLDDLSPAYRAYLFALQNKPIDGAETNEANRRSSVFKRFESVYLHRRNECLTCHNTFASTTGPGSHWDRMHPLPMYLEEAVYGGHAGRTDEKELHAPFRVSGVNSGSIAPWGLQSCGSFARPSSPDPESATGFGFLTRNLGRQSSIFDVEALLAGGVRNLRDGLARCTSSPANMGTTCTTCTSGFEPPLSPAQIVAQNDVRTLFSTSGCFGCHASGQGALTMTATNFVAVMTRRPAAGDTSKALVNPGCANGTEAGCGGRGSHLMERLTSTDPARRMPRPPVAPLTSTQIDTVRAWINGLPANAGCGGSVCTAAVASCANNPTNGAYARGDEALAMMAATSIVNVVWTEVMGYPLTIDLYHPRNEAQRNILWNLTEYTFVEGNWSLRHLLVRILMFDYFNRRAPVTGDGVAAGSVASPYELPLMFNPWAEGDPRRPPIALPGWTAASAPVPDPAYQREAVANRPSHFDPMSDAVHRHSARALLNSAASALDWTRPQRFYPNSYPSKNLGLAMGDYWRDTEPGFRGTSFTSLLNWEFVHGRCAKPAGLATDWVDRLVGAIPAFDAANPGSALRIEDLARSVKDWMLNDASINGAAPIGFGQTETQVLESLFGATLSDAASSVPALADKARRYCGMLLQTPQFMLAGAEPPAGPGPRPRLRVCNGGACSYQEICNELGPSVMRHGRPDFRCERDSLEDPFTLPDRINEWRTAIELMCRRGPCEIVTLPPFCRPGGGPCPVPPGCDPRIDGCGGPLPPIELAHQVRNGGVLTLPFDSPAAKMLLAVAKHVRGNATLPAGTAPLPGDWVLLPPGGALRDGLERVAVPKRDAREQTGVDGIVVLLRDAPQMSFATHRLPYFAFPIEETGQRLSDPALHFGSGGAPLGAPRPFDPRENDERMRRPR